MTAADCDRFFANAPAGVLQPVNPLETALNAYYDRETALIRDFIHWQKDTNADPSRLQEFGLTVTGEVVSGGVCAVLRHHEGGSLTSGPVMLNTNEADPYQAAFAQAARLLLVVVR